MRMTESAQLGELVMWDEIEFVNLSDGDLPVLISLGFGKLRSLSLRHLRAKDLTCLASFPQLENLDVWQSESVQSLKGIDSLQHLKWLSLMELGPLPSLEPLICLSKLAELSLSGGVWKFQQLEGDFAPVAALKSLRRLSITSFRGPTDVSPLLGLPLLEDLHIPTALIPVPEVAKLAASYPFWRRKQPWIYRLPSRTYDPKGCPKCGEIRIMLLLQRKKRMWCESCDSVRLKKVLEDLEEQIVSHLPAAG